MSLGFFPSLIDCPTKIKFADQEKDEVIELFLRRHWVTNLSWLVLTILAIALPFIFTKINEVLKLVQITVPSQLVISAWVLWYMLVVAYILENFLHWYFNIYIVTNTHLVDINFYNLLSRDATEVRLEDVQSSKPQVQGVLGSLFNYGDLTIETAAERQQIHFADVPKPDFVRERIQDLQETKER